MAAGSVLGLCVNEYELIMFTQCNNQLVGDACCPGPYMSVLQAHAGAVPHDLVVGDSAWGRFVHVDDNEQEQQRWELGVVECIEGDRVFLVCATDQTARYELAKCDIIPTFQQAPEHDAAADRYFTCTGVAVQPFALQPGAFYATVEEGVVFQVRGVR